MDGRDDRFFKNQEKIISGDGKTIGGNVRRDRPDGNGGKAAAQAGPDHEGDPCEDRRGKAAYKAGAAQGDQRCAGRFLRGHSGQLKKERKSDRNHFSSLSTNQTLRSVIPSGIPSTQPVLLYCQKVKR